MADETENQSSEQWEGEENIPGASERHSHVPSEIDAMGKQKRRQVVGGQYGASARKQLTVYGIFVAILTVVVIAFLTVVSSIDNREMPLENTAPWTEATATQLEPRELDFPHNGPENTIPPEEIGKATAPSETESLEPEPE